MDNVSDTMDTKSFHQLFIYGRLAGIQVLPIT
jgi:hypothetical protein